MTIPLAAGMASEGYRVRTVVNGPGLQALSADRYEVSLQSPDAIESLHRLVCGREGDRIGCLVNLLPLAEGQAGDEAQVATELARSWFYVLKEFQEDLCESAEEGGGWVFNVTALDGQFGLGSAGARNVAHAGTIGLTKSVKREFPRLCVRNLDIDPSLEPALIASRLFEEIAADDDRLEIGLTAGKRYRIDLVETPVTRARPDSVLGSDSVVLMTGGAYGITADVTLALAKARGTVILVGRSPLPGEEPAETRPLDLPALRRYLLEECRSRGEPPLPAEIERRAARLLKNRAIRENLESFREAGARVEYHALDVRDEQAFGHLIDDIYARFGRIDGVVHGAGVIHDKPLRAKTAKMFDDVFGTKVDSAFVLARRLRPESLKFLVLFSSIAGRFGNVGQTDYSAANEVLNKLSGRLSHEWSHARVVAINWGPWDAGMVNDALREMFASHGISLIPVDDGVACFLRELDDAAGPFPEVVLSCSVSETMRRETGAQ